MRHPFAARARRFPKGDRKALWSPPQRRNLLRNGKNKKRFSPASHKKSVSCGRFRPPAGGRGTFPHGKVPKGCRGRPKGACLMAAPGPPLRRYGHFPLSLDRQGPYRAPYLVWPGARNQSDAAAGTHFTWPRCWGTYCGKVALPWRHLAITPRIGRRHGAGGGISCAEGDSGPPGNGREPSWARPCEASGAL